METEPVPTSGYGTTPLLLFFLGGRGVKLAGQRSQEMVAEQEQADEDGLQLQSQAAPEIIQTLSNEQ